MPHLQTWQICTSTSTTTSADTKTTLNGGNDLKLWTLGNGQGQYVGRVAWYQAATAAYTAAQSSIQKTFIESNDVGGIGPKVYVMPNTHGGLGTFGAAEVPMIDLVPYNFWATGGQNLTISALAQVANTAAFRVGAGLELCLGPKPVEMFYDAPTNETSTGTAAGRVSLGTISVNNSGTFVTGAIRIGVGTVTASESYVGYGEMECPQLSGIQKVQFNVQPMGVGLGAAISVHLPGDYDAHFAIPFSNPATFTCYYNQEEALTSAGTAIPVIGYVKNGRP